MYKTVSRDDLDFIKTQSITRSLFWLVALQII